MKAAGARGRPHTAAGGLRWAVGGAALGLLLALPAFAPASWLATTLASDSGGRLLLADARGTVWRGSARPVLAGGPGSRDAAALPDRLHWRIGLDILPRPAFVVHLQQACCLVGRVAMRIEPGWSGAEWRLLAAGPQIGRWPSAWLSGLGTPWNTMQLGGTMRLEARELRISRIAGRLQVSGSAAVELERLSSPLSTLPTLGSYRLGLSGSGAGPAQLTLSTLKGPLQLAGSGEWAVHGVRFRGEARADSGAETALSNLLNIVGRRDQARSLISIG